MAAKITLIMAILVSSWAWAAGKKSASWDPSRDTDFAKILCTEDFYFRTCFQTSQKNCESAVRDLSQTCAALVEREPASNDEVLKAARVGLCVGERLEKQWRDRKVNDAKCDRAENWQ